MKPGLSLDGHKLLHHLGPVCRWQAGKEIYPVYCAISLTTSCNLNCVFCVYDSIKRTKDALDKDAVMRFVGELAANGLKAVYFSGEGEPLMHPQAVEIISGVKALGVDCALNSNGYYLTPEVAEKLLPHLTYARISINGGGAANYKEIHRTSIKTYDKIVQNLAEAVNIRKRKGLDVTLGAQCIILAENLDLIAELARDLKKTGIDYLALKPFLPFDLLEYKTPLDLQDPVVQKKLAEIEALGDKNFRVIVRWESLAKIEKRTYDQCLSAPFMLEVDSKGELYLCGVLLGRDGYSYGNIHEKTYRQILDSVQYKKVMDRIAGLDVHGCMPNCRNDAVNRFLWDIKYPPMHVNFI